MKKTNAFALILILTTTLFIWTPIAATISDPEQNSDAILTAYGKVLSSKGIDPAQANFPLEAKRQILKTMEKDNLAVIAGFYYRDLDNNGQYDAGEELSATLLGGPEIDAKGISQNSYFNCYWFDPVKSGKSYQIIYQHDGVEPFSLEIRPKEGLNIVHIRINPTKPLIYILPHSHFDPEWESTYEGYLKGEIPHIEQRLDLMQADPAHGFYNDEELVTRPFVERTEPKYVDMLRQGMIDGMVEPKGLITQNELTMPYGESMIRVITNGERMLSDLLGVKIRPEVFSSIDQYGYGYQMPQILKKSGRNYFLFGEYLMKDEESHKIPHSDPDIDKQSEFWLQGPDGSKVLAYREHYADRDSFDPRYTPVLSHHSAFKFEGDDFCPPDPMLTKVIDSLNALEGPFKYIISPSISLFRAIESTPEIPTYTSERFINRWSGVYETRVEGRIQGRKLENRILATESLATMASLMGMSYPQHSMEEAWFQLLVNQDHDPVMTPMAIPGLFEGSVLPRYETAEAYVNASLTGTLNWMTPEITANEQPGSPVIVFNPLANKRSIVVQTTIPVLFSGVGVTDLHGKAVESQLLEKSAVNTTVAFLAEDLPPLGWKTYYVSEAIDPLPELSNAVIADRNLIENEHLRIELKEGVIQRIIDKDSGDPVFHAESHAGVNEILIWKDEGCISIVRPVDKEEVADFIDNPGAELVGRSSEVEGRKVTVMETGPARGVLQIEYDLDCGRFVQKISLDKDSRVIRFSTNVIWNGTDKISDLNGRRIRIAFNSVYKNSRVFCDIPFGVIEWKQSEQIRPVNSWLGIENGSGGAAFCHQGPQSIQVVDDVAYMTLFRSILEPSWENARCGWDNPEDEALENGEHRFNYSVYIHQGDWKTANVPGISSAENRPVFVKVPFKKPSQYESTPWLHPAPPLLAGESSLISVKPAGLVVSAVKPTEYSETGVIVRLYNPTGEPVSGTLAAGFPNRGAETVNFREELISPLPGEDGEFTLEVGPYEIMTVRIIL